MPRRLPPGLQQLLLDPYVNVETHSTMSLTVDKDGVVAAYYLATTEMIIGGVTYAPHLRENSEISFSITRAVNQATARIQNVDTILGIELFNLSDYLYTSEIKMGRAWIDMRNGAILHHNFLTGVAVTALPDENYVEVTAISHAYASTSVGAARVAARGCQFKYRHRYTCGSTSNLTTCSLRRDDTDGCNGRHPTDDDRAKYGGMVYMDSKISAQAN